MLTHLRIHDFRERLIVGILDLLLTLTAPFLKFLTIAPDSGAQQRILLLRLERIGDLLMTLDAIALVRSRAPEARIDLAVGSWNCSLAKLIPHINHIDHIDMSWLTRNGSHGNLRELWTCIRRWRATRYNLTINFEADVRSNLVMALIGAPERAGFDIKGGGALLTKRIVHNAEAHTSRNAIRLVDHVLPGRAPLGDDEKLTVRLQLPPDVVQHSTMHLPGIRDNVPWIGIHASGGREIKQWDPLRFAEVGTRLAREHGAVLVLTGSTSDRLIVEQVKTALPPDVPVVDLVGQMQLVDLAGVLSQLQVFLSADTGPMHLAAAVGTPVVAIFGPADPKNYRPLGPNVRIIRIDLPCSPCNQIRRPPCGCRGYIPDCLVGVEADSVFDAAVDLLHGRSDRNATLDITKRFST